MLKNVVFLVCPEWHIVTFILRQNKYMYVLNSTKCYITNQPKTKWLSLTNVIPVLNKHVVLKPVVLVCVINLSDYYH